MRVFVASPFLGMQADRDELVKDAFQRLRLACQERAVSWAEVDFRWGITEQEQLDGMVLPLCFGQIDECRPYFVGLLGGRYGTAVDVFPEAVLEQHPWLADYEGCSVTELEMTHAALRDPAQAERAFFYFRDARGGDGDARDPRTERLKAKLRGADLRCGEYESPQELAEAVFRDLSRALYEDFPLEGESDRRAQLARAQWDFAAEHGRVFVGREDVLASLEGHVGGGGSLVLTGESGVGKTAILAELVNRTDMEKTAAYFAGVNPRGTDWRDLVSTVLTQLGLYPASAPRTASEYRVAMAAGLERLSRDGGGLVVIDAVNQLAAREGARELAWLPERVPENVRVIVSTVSGPTLDACRRRGMQELQVEPLRPAESRELAEAYLEQRYAKRLEPEYLEALLEHPLATLPLWLTVLLEELRLFGDFEKLEATLSSYLDCASVDALFERVLERWDGDYAAPRYEALVRTAVTAMLSSRRGLLEMELRDFVATRGELSGVDWAAFRAAATPFLANRGGLITVYHDYMRHAAERRYGEAGLHRELADFFVDRHEVPERRREELPWQLQRAGDWGALHELVGELDFAMALWEQDPLDVQAYWTTVESAGVGRRTEAYPEVVQAPGQQLEAASFLGELLSSGSFFAESRDIYRALRQGVERDVEPVRWARAAMGEARLDAILDEYGSPLTILRQVEEVFRTHDEQQDLMVCLGEIGHAEVEAGELDAALAHFREAEGIARQIDDLYSLQALLVGEVEVYDNLGDVDAAERKLEEAERVIAALSDRDARQRALGRRASLAEKKRDYDAMLRFAREQHALSRELGDRSSMAVSAGMIATAHGALRQWTEAWNLFEQAAGLLEEIGDAGRVADMRINQAVLLLNQDAVEGEPELVRRAQALCEAQRRVYERLGRRAGLGTCLATIAECLERVRGADQDSVDLRLAAIDAEEAAGRRFAAAGMRCDLATVLIENGEADGALGLLNEALGYYGGKARVPSALSRGLRLLARAHTLGGRPWRAAIRAKQAEDWARRAGRSDLVAMARDAQAAVLEAQGNYEGALSIRELEVAAWREANNPGALAAAHHHLSRTAALAQDWGRALKAQQDRLTAAFEAGDTRKVRADLEEAVAGLEGMQLEGELAAYRRGLEGLLGVVRDL